jgi:HIRAN domain
MHSPRRSILVGLAIALAFGAATAQEVRVLVQSSPIAGFRYHDAPKIWDELQAGDTLALVHEPGNPHDKNAVRVEWRGRMLGYVPRKENAALAWALARGERLSARVSRLRDSPNPRERIEFEVFAD